MIVNIEMQRKRPTEYPLHNRAVYYACRAISSQKERDFRGRHYGDIKDTYSIWICMNEQTNSICDYRLVRDQIMGDAEWPAILDLMHVLLIGVSNDVPEPCESNALHRLLCTLFSEKMTSDSVLNILAEEYNIPITDRLGEEVNDMCNLGEGILERGIEQGIEQGRASATTEFVTNMFKDHRTADEIADILKLSLDNVTAILTRQGLLQ